MVGLTQEGLSADLDSTYGDWGDVVVYDGNVIPGFLKEETVYETDGDGNSKPTGFRKILFTSRLIPLQGRVTINSVKYKVLTQEGMEGQYTYNLREDSNG